MKLSQIKPEQLYFLIGLTLFAVLMRFAPHLYNVTPITAIALLSGFHFRRPGLAALIPVLAMFFSDLLLGFHSTMLFVYLPLVSIVFLGHALRALKPESEVPVKESLGFAFIGALIFFFVSNFGVWATQSFYAPNLSGLISCFIAGLPFFERSLLGDLMFTALLFSVYSLACDRFPKLKCEAYHGR